ncbi:group I truncated hemoglobin [Leptospira sp. GIMC2001]|uniref:group I truncated hemoglobin n=1 Tax=Leptospira sp. GIMC2001 TaxID=1513297 RepID=UPI00234A3E53|nr:group 1 truncated hemoglobin [Leptospira sp. GIMC2001]WCL49685.1 group 1 truncated hemoglobin [Leptospira sp. GIMC2001]
MTIYEQIGETNIQKVVGMFYSRVLLDKDLFPYFSDANIIDLKEHQVQFLSFCTGGPEYRGRSLESAHSGLEIKEEHFMKVGQHLVVALKAYKVSEDIIAEIMKIVISVKDQVVNR